MVQEFQVLRCFSCQTFQVQQVKKSKKWTCKMCGEKQSLIKEYGRGTGADCRRHVQKLNSLRGELLEVENERAQAQWKEKKECREEDGFGDEAQSCEQQDEEQATESRWSKYVDLTKNEPSGDEDEEENVYTQRARFRSRDKMSRKRKNSFTSKGTCGRYTVGEDEEPDADPVHLKAKVSPFQLHRHGGSFKSSPAPECSSKESLITTGFSKSSISSVCSLPVSTLISKQVDVYRDASAHGGCYTGEYKQPCEELTTEHLLSSSASDLILPSSSFQRSSETKTEAVSSRWAQFLTTASAEEEKDEMEEDACAQMISGAPDSVVAQSPSEPFMAVPTVTLKTTGHLKSDAGVCARASLDEVLDLKNRSTRVFEKLSQCITGMTSNSPLPYTSKPDVAHSPVCFQLPPVIKPCPALSLSTFFQTNEDFDDSF
ncbi:MRN complex-interacting protein isoform X1 [Astyanax mexicanus]|uniref:MRN complex-interacting protein isoform X1 n=1 Tax=Astyanax mexicanus TaxID=7994 RepID=A0A8T2LS18_ASTMX|nr:MRN complex-interacting protein isoform X1 [Astyanax mexicanus]